MQDRSKDLISTINGEPHLLNPADGQYHRIVDARKSLLPRANASEQLEKLAFKQAFEKCAGMARRPVSQTGRSRSPEALGTAAFSLINIGAIFTWVQ